MSLRFFHLPKEEADLFDDELSAGWYAVDSQASLRRYDSWDLVVADLKKLGFGSHMIVSKPGKTAFDRWGRILPQAEDWGAGAHSTWDPSRTDKDWILQKQDVAEGLGEAAHGSDCSI